MFVASHTAEFRIISLEKIFNILHANGEMAQKVERRDTRQTPIQAKAIAAAKLVLQDLDPEARKRRRNFTSGSPQGTRPIEYACSIAPTN